MIIILIMNIIKKKELQKLKTIVKQKGLKYTRQREIIFEIILDAKEHLSAEDIYKRVLQKYPNEKMGIATVYRALSFLEDAKLILSISFDKDGKKYEANCKEHHDHLICVRCGKIVEFVSKDIEKAQEKVAKENGFKLLDHTMYLYGICSQCLK
jgi:Fur family ferric uptake transcriptional regulator